MSNAPDSLIATLRSIRAHHKMPLQLRPLAHRFVSQVMGLLFPHFADSVGCDEEAVLEDVIVMRETLGRLIRSIETLHDVPADLVENFVRGLEAAHALLLEDAQAIFEGDPAARSVDEVMVTYPGFFSIAVYRIAHLLHVLGLVLLPRLLTEIAHEKTGIDLHPGAHIGRRFCIDHGTAVVIGETTVIGDNVKIYQSVTLGALTVNKQLADSKRHPTIEHDVVIYAGATILGGGTTIGHHSIIAGNAFVTHSIPSHSVVNRKGEIRPRDGAVEIEFNI